MTKIEMQPKITPEFARQSIDQVLEMLRSEADTYNQAISILDKEPVDQSDLFAMYKLAITQKELFLNAHKLPGIK